MPKHPPTDPARYARIRALILAATAAAPIACKETTPPSEPIVNRPADPPPTAPPPQVAPPQPAVAPVPSDAPGPTPNRPPHSDSLNEPMPSPPTDAP